MNFSSKKILIITSTNLSCNPRCLKEVKLLSQLNASVTVVAFKLHNWTDITEPALVKELANVKCIYLESTKLQFIPWFLASLFERLSRMLTYIFATGAFLAAIAISKRSWLLLQWAKKYNETPDLIIAHNSPAFLAAAVLAKRKSVPVAFDVEDFHPREGNDRLLQKNSTVLMKKLFSRTVYMSFASPLIKYYSEKLLGNLGSRYLVVNNVFPSVDFIQPGIINSLDEKIQLVWFSQFIDYGRGLEIILPELDRLQENFDLTLIGSLREVFFENELKGRSYIKYIPSLSQVELNHSLNMFDVGLALENALDDFNRDICLTNKIWSYLQAGLYILASDTEAQRLFLEQHPGHGISSSLTSEEIYRSLNYLIQEKASIRGNRNKRFDDVKFINWESESNILIEEWGNIMLAS